MAGAPVKRPNGRVRAPEPIIVLGPLGSRGSLFAAVLGRHPALVAAPHLNLLAFEMPKQFLRFARVPRDVHLHGLLRMLSWLLTAEQSVEGVQAGRRWLTRNGEMVAGAAHRLIGGLAQPRRLVDYSPLYVHSRDVLQRVVAAAPDATFIHLVRHPSATSLEIGQAAMQSMNAALNHWTAYSTNQPSLDLIDLTDTAVDWTTEPPVFDPQFLWHRTHMAIGAALADLPRQKTIRVRVEDLVANPKRLLSALCARLNLPFGNDVLARMLRVRDDPFALPGPFGAPGGVDWDFVSHPRMPRPEALPPMGGELPWRGDGLGYRPETIALAEELGYRSTGLLGAASAQWNLLHA